MFNTKFSVISDKHSVKRCMKTDTFLQVYSFTLELFYKEGKQRMKKKVCQFVQIVFILVLDTPSSGSFWSKLSKDMKIEILITLGLDLINSKNRYEQEYTRSREVIYKICQFLLDQPQQIREALNKAFQSKSIVKIQKVEEKNDFIFSFN